MADVTEFPSHPLPLADCCLRCWGIIVSVNIDIAEAILFEVLMQIQRRGSWDATRRMGDNSSAHRDNSAVSERKKERSPECQEEKMPDFAWAQEDADSR